MGILSKILKEIKVVGPKSLEVLSSLLNKHKDEVFDYLEQGDFLDPEEIEADTPLTFKVNYEYNFVDAYQDDYQMGFAFSFSLKDIINSEVGMEWGGDEDLRFKIENKNIYWGTYMP